MLQRMDFVSEFVIGRVGLVEPVTPSGAGEKVSE
jgi:hypothetical protein